MRRVQEKQIKSINKNLALDLVLTSIYMFKITFGRKRSLGLVANVTQTLKLFSQFNRGSKGSIHIDQARPPATKFKRTDKIF